MRIDGNGRIAGAQAGTNANRTRTGSAFSLDMGASASEAGSARAAATVGGLDAMLALQSIGDPLERRRRAVKRGKAMLDSLDRMKLAMLDGGTAPEAMSNLAAILHENRDASDDPGLESVLDEIELRAAVEMAKREGARR
jgi:hypothetical protein